MSVTYTDLPKESLLHAYIKDGDFMDCVHGAKAPPHMKASQIAQIGLVQMPAWVMKLMWSRNKIVSVFGLKTGEDQSIGPTIPTEFSVGDRIGVFRIMEVSETEVILGEDDKHLDFRISALCNADGYYLSTWVHTHNWLGKTYLALVMPFHRIISQNSMKRVLKNTV